MELHQLKYFLAIVETGTFSKAATHTRQHLSALARQFIHIVKEEYPGAGRDRATNPETVGTLKSF
ncbi:MAG: LysR family transcriptional regulator [Anaerolineales bacterium]|nr:LysR family transcriptional regulator [Anaerolineales bacterium]